MGGGGAERILVAYAASAVLLQSHPLQDQSEVRKTPAAPISTAQPFLVYFSV